MKNLITLLNILSADVIPSLDILAITNNSREVSSGTLFVAYRGEKSDGRDFIKDALQKGAAAIAYDPDPHFELPTTTIPCIAISALKTKQSLIAARFYDYPSIKVPVIGVTGTNGKTSVTHFIAQSLANTGVIGTLGYGIISASTALHKTINTTPDGLQIQKMLSELVGQHARAIAMEVSSHALVQQRVNDVDFEIAVFTNLTQDHLDFHQTMENYRDAKALLFATPAHSKPRYAIINIDNETGRFFSKQFQATWNILTYSCHDETADIAVIRCEPTANGFDLDIKTPWGTGNFHLPLIGRFNIENVLATAGVLGVLKMPFNTILDKLSCLKNVTGRMQLYHFEQTPYVVIDYAHTPDALEKVLQNLRTHCKGKLWCIFGCGGERDKTKRFIMGKIADTLSDHIIITNDNPRSEDPNAIAHDIAGGISHHKYSIELDRDKAIQLAVQSAKHADWILIAGKGHETEQIMKNERLHHNDADCALTYLQALKRSP